MDQRFSRGLENATMNNVEVILFGIYAQIFCYQVLAAVCQGIKMSSYQQPLEVLLCLLIKDAYLAFTSILVISDDTVIFSTSLPYSSKKNSFTEEL